MANRLLAARSYSEERLINDPTEDWLEYTLAKKRTKFNNDKDEEENAQTKIQQQQEIPDRREKADSKISPDKSEGKRKEKDEEENQKEIEGATQFLANALPQMLFQFLQGKHFEVKYSLTRPEAFAPIRATKGSVGYDVISPIDVAIFPDEYLKIPLFLKLHLEHTGIYAQLRGRSGLSFNDKITFVGSGIIDSDFEGQIEFPIKNDDKKQIFFVRRGMRIGQLIFAPFHTVKLIPMTSFEANKEKEYKAITQHNENRVRGSGGFGSTGYK